MEAQVSPKVLAGLCSSVVKAVISLAHTQVWRMFWGISCIAESCFFDAEHPCKMFMRHSKYISFCFCVCTRSILLSK